jgi:hypothetical protein
VGTRGKTVEEEKPQRRGPLAMTREYHTSQKYASINNKKQ